MKSPFEFFYDKFLLKISQYHVCFLLFLAFSYNYCFFFFFFSLLYKCSAWEFSRLHSYWRT